MYIYSTVGYRFNEENKSRIRISSIKRSIGYNNNQENDFEESSDTAGSEIGGYVITTTGGTGSIFLSGILTEIEDASNISTTVNNNNETIKVRYII